MNRVNIRHIALMLMFAGTLLAIPFLSMVLLSEESVAEMDGVDLERSDNISTVYSNTYAIMFLVDGVWYTSLDGNSASVDRYDLFQSAVTLDIPSTVTSPTGKEYTVVEIAEGAFNIGHNLESITIPDTVKRIGKGAFANCDTVVTLSIPIDVVCEENAFENIEIRHLTLTKGTTGSSQNEYWKPWVDSVETLTVGEGIVEFGTVSVWKKLSSVTLKDVAQIGKYQFSGCEMLLEVHAPKVGDIGEHAFEYCTSLQTLDLGPVTNVGKGAFHGCHGITTITGNVFMSDGMLFIPIDDWRASVVHYVGNGNKKLEIPEIVKMRFDKRYAVTSISAEAFMDATDLYEIHIPDSILDIGAHAFKGCESLETLTMPIGARCCYGTEWFAFEGADPIILTLTKGGYDPDTYMGNEFWSSWKSCLQWLRTEQGITEFGTSFEGDVLLGITFVDVQEIHKEQFKNCKELSSVYACKVTTIGEHAFKNCTDLNIINLDSVKSIGKKAFTGCKSVVSITLPIDTECFYGTKDYAFDNFKPSNLTLIGSGYDPDTYMNNEFWKPWAPHIRYLEVKAGITQFETSFENGELVTVVMESVQKIHGNQFKGCNGLLEVRAPEVEEIGDYAFMHCASLHSLNIDYVTNLGNRAFYGCYSICSVTGNLFLCKGMLFIPIDDSRASIVQLVSPCEEKLEIPETANTDSGKMYNVTSISAEAFMEVPNLTSVHIPECILDIGTHAFKGCKSLGFLSIPIGARCGYGTEGYAFEGVEPFSLILSCGGYDPDTYMSNEFWKPWVSSIRLLNVGEGITQFETSFEGKNLNILMMNSVHTVLKDQFKNCDELTGVSITGARYIDESAFMSCELLLKVICGDLKVIGPSSFSNCDILKEFVATNVEIIKESAFYKCEYLEYFPFIGTIRIDSKAFYDTMVAAPGYTLLGGPRIDIADDAFGTAKPPDDGGLEELISGIITFLLCLYICAKFFFTFWLACCTANIPLFFGSILIFILDLINILEGIAGDTNDDPLWDPTLIIV